jgi:hypothetical protein
LPNLSLDQRRNLIGKGFSPDRLFHFSLSTRGARRGTLNIWHSHYLIRNTVGLLLILIIRLTDSEFGPEYAGSHHLLYGLIAGSFLEV